MKTQNHVWKRIAKSKMKKSDQVWYFYKGTYEYGFMLKKVTSKVKMKAEGYTPFGAKKGQKMVTLWNPLRSFGGIKESNVAIPVSKVSYVKRSYRK